MTNNHKIAFALVIAAVGVFLAYQAGYNTGKDAALRANLASEVS